MQMFAVLTRKPIQVIHAACCQARGNLVMAQPDIDVEVSLTMSETHQMKCRKREYRPHEKLAVKGHANGCGGEHLAKRWVAGERQVCEGREVVQKLQIDHVQITAIMLLNSIREPGWKRMRLMCLMT